MKRLHFIPQSEKPLRENRWRTVVCIFMDHARLVRPNMDLDGREIPEEERELMVEISCFSVKHPHHHYCTLEEFKANYEIVDYIE